MSRFVAVLAPSLLAEVKETSLASLIAKTWVTIEFGNHEYDHVQGYDQVVNIATEVVLGANEPGYEHEKFRALMEEIKPFVRRYDKVNVISKRDDRTAKEQVGQGRAGSTDNRSVAGLGKASKSKQFV
jgi:hypothetical protein